MVRGYRKAKLDFSKRGTSVDWSMVGEQALSGTPEFCWMAVCWDSEVLRCLRYELLYNTGLAVELTECIANVANIRVVMASLALLGSLLTTKQWQVSMEVNTCH